MKNRSTAVRMLLLAAGLVALTGTGAWGQVAAPGDVYYAVHLDQQFQYYVLAGSFVTWESVDAADTALTDAAAHDSAFTYGAVGVSAAWHASAGDFRADLFSHINADARTGIYHRLTNAIRVSVYVKGPTGTPWWATVTDSGQVDVSRLGGLPGTLQPVNGTSTAAFGDSSASVNYTGSVSVPAHDSLFTSGFTTSKILVGAETYSLARTWTFSAPTSISQTICVLGCMQSAATFAAVAGGHAAIHVFPFATPLAVPRGPGEPAALALGLAPNPVRATTAVRFRAGRGERTRIEVFDVGGRRLECLFDAPATGTDQRVTWSAGGRPAGVYLIRMSAGNQVSVVRAALLE